MGCFVPQPGEFVRIVIEIDGKRGLEQEDYDAFKAEIQRIAKTHGARITAGEHVKIADPDPLRRAAAKTKKSPKKKGAK